MRPGPLSTLFCALVALASSGAVTSGRASTEEKVVTPPPRTVLELYTSQGCSSCPAADALFHKYASRPDVIALTMPVDYWDYLGWKDTLANPKFSQRQRKYAKVRGDGRIYTPQVIVNGLTHAVGSKEADIDKQIEATNAQLAAHRIGVRMVTKDGKLTIEAEGLPGNAPQTEGIKDATIWLAVLQKSAEVEIKRGENHGRKVTYVNVVRELTSVGTWSGKPLKIVLERHAVMQPGTESCVVFLQQGMGGPIIGAAEVDRW